eukprot:TRINITY_DN2801_c0_g1_i1.p1 TRINITY_DN2801_c0_g1~~TRINITY_DN2801_c0_g1_i1.p1  ORF type:complete len:221 (-),score=43.36 TRINITY_DN2801_c0_g1_i1:120-782(-)
MEQSSQYPSYQAALSKLISHLEHTNKFYSEILAQVDSDPFFKHLTQCQKQDLCLKLLPDLMSQQSIFHQLEDPKSQKPNPGIPNQLPLPVKANKMSENSHRFSQAQNSPLQLNVNQYNAQPVYPSQNEHQFQNMYGNFDFQQHQVTRAHQEVYDHQPQSNFYNYSPGYPKLYPGYGLQSPGSLPGVSQQLRFQPGLLQEKDDFLDDEEDDDDEDEDEDDS